MKVYMLSGIFLNLPIAFVCLFHIGCIDFCNSFSLSNPEHPGNARYLTIGSMLIYWRPISL